MSTETKVLEQYLSDLYAIFQKKLAAFIIDGKLEDSIKLPAILQEIIKVKSLMQ